MRNIKIALKSKELKSDVIQFKAELEKKGTFTKLELAKLFGVNYAVLLNIYNEKPIRDSSLIKICKIMKKSPGDYLTVKV